MENSHQHELKFRSTSQRNLTKIRKKSQKAIFLTTWVIRDCEGLKINNQKEAAHDDSLSDKCVTRYTLRFGVC